jgi:glycerol-3-phosphate dehydrogenase
MERMSKVRGLLALVSRTSDGKKRMEFVNRDFNAAINIRKCAVLENRPPEWTRENFIGQPLKVELYAKKFEEVVCGRSRKTRRRLHVSWRRFVYGAGRYYCTPLASFDFRTALMMPCVRMRRSFSKIALCSAAAFVSSATVLLLGGYDSRWYTPLVARAHSASVASVDHGPLPVLETPPRRHAQLRVLKESGMRYESVQKRKAEAGGDGSSKEAMSAVVPSALPEDGLFDILVVGGGATGSGVALDATLRGLRVALVERNDFASGTSSRSTKLIHGGVRYLEKAFFRADPAQLKLVFEALHERAIMLRQAPHLTQPLPTILPCYKWWEIPFYWAGLKAYDFLAIAGNGALYMSKFLSAAEARRQFPTLSARRGRDGATLKGSIVYYDGQMDDARFNVTLAVTAALHGSVIANHTEVSGLIKDAPTGKVIGATVRDRFTGEEFPVYARVIVNATGPFADRIRAMDEGPEALGPQRMIVPSSGVHVTLPSYYSPEGMGLIVPKTRDGRVVFMLPWLGSTIAGTTDSSTEITDMPRPHEAEIEFILDALRDYLNVEVRRKDVQSAWSGIRPLAIDPKAKDTQNILREHTVHVSGSGLLTIAGGKWTTYRKMAQDTVDTAIKVAMLESRVKHKCLTEKVILTGGHTYDPSYFAFLTQHYERVKYSVSKGAKLQTTTLDVDIAQHLARAYGDQAYKICDIASREDAGYGKRIAHGYPYIEAEVVYAAENEYCETAQDFLARRSRLAFLNARAAKEALPRIAEILAEIHGWSRTRLQTEMKEAMEFLETFESGRTTGEVGEQVEAVAA